MLSAVVFDYGLTLVTFERPRQALLGALERVRAWLGPQAPPAEVLLREVLEPLDARLPAAVAGEREIDYLEYVAGGWRRAGFELDRETVRRIVDLEQRCWDSAARLAPGALETLDTLRRRGLLTGLASNAPFPAEGLHRQLRLLGLDRRLDAVIFSSEVGLRKPSPSLYQRVLERLGVQPDRALFVGDRVREDWEGPRRLGMQAILCTALAQDPAADGLPQVASLPELLRLPELGG
jgi:HAD superfamily hydrolase (TIGR01509 family)